MKNIHVSLDTLLAIAHAHAEEEGTCLLYSGGMLDSAQRSYLFLFPYHKVYVSDGRIASTRGDATYEDIVTWENVKNALSEPSGSMRGNWVFFLSYEMGFLTEKKLERFYQPSSAIDACFFLHACCIEFDMRRGQASITIDEKGYPFLTERQKAMIDRLLDSKDPDIVLETRLASSPRATVSFSATQKWFMDSVRTIQELIRRGDVYQLTLSHEIKFQFDLAPFDLFLRLISRNPTPFSAYFKFGKEAIVSCSPERLLRKESSRVETRPIKGTRPRGKSPEADQKMRRELEQSRKEVAELVMITDLMRNDLSKICVPGSVVVPELLRTEVYQDLFHRVSIIQGQCVDGAHPMDVLRAVFPGGSVTGCPKIRAMELIKRIENRRRGPYTGSIGVLQSNNDLDCNILIRTLHYKAGQYSLQVGGGIVIDSDPQSEWEETLHKASHFMNTMRGE